MTAAKRDRGKHASPSGETRRRAGHPYLSTTVERDLADALDLLMSEGHPKAQVLGAALRADPLVQDALRRLATGLQKIDVPIGKTC